MTQPRKPVPLENVRLIPRREVEVRPKPKPKVQYKWVDIPEPKKPVGQTQPARRWVQDPPKPAPVQPYQRRRPAPRTRVQVQPLPKQGFFQHRSTGWWIGRSLLTLGVLALTAVGVYIGYEVFVFVRWLVIHWYVAVAAFIVLAIVSRGKALEVIAACAKCGRPF